MQSQYPPFRETSQVIFDIQQEVWSDFDLSLVFERQPQERRGERHRGRLGRSVAMCRRLPPHPGGRSWDRNICDHDITNTVVVLLNTVTWAE